MHETMEAMNGMGLAANQVGKTIRLIVMIWQGKKYTMFNPAILKRSHAKYIMPGGEGCLSLPGKHIEVKRNSDIAVKYMDENGKIKFEHFYGAGAVCVQHEIDHLNGVLMTDYA